MEFFFLVGFAVAFGISFEKVMNGLVTKALNKREDRPENIFEV
ncbi:MAG TPA: hypothetical protein VK846_00650 [Candidatus Limnocylindria bacterium]|nr:hypothetical protein [Candidatus Limnocylindria bacterium]